MPVKGHPERCRAQGLIPHAVTVNIDPHLVRRSGLLLLRLNGIGDQDRVEIQLPTLQAGAQFQGFKAQQLARAGHTPAGQAGLLNDKSPLLTLPGEVSTRDIERFEKRQHVHPGLAQRHPALGLQTVMLRTEAGHQPAADLSGLRVHHSLAEQRSNVPDGRLRKGQGHTSLL